MVRKSEKRIIANYIGWRVAKATMRYLGSQARKIRHDFRKSVYGYKTEWPRYLELICYNYLIIILITNISIIMTFSKSHMHMSLKGHP